MNETMVVWVGAAVAVILLFLIVRLSIMVGKISESMAKLGFVIREDAKKYFDDASQKLIDTNQGFQEQYTQIVATGTKSALSEAGNVMEGALSKAQQDAGSVILQAREEARRIIQAAQNDATQYSDKALNQATATIHWVMEEYTKRAISLDEHRDIVITLLEQYINENRK